MPGYKRKPGDWKSVANSRAQIPRIALGPRGLTNIPNIGDTGSAAYRRLMKRQGNR